MDSFPRNLTIGNTKITEKSLIAKSLNGFFFNIAPKLASVIPKKTKTFQTFSPEISTVLNGTINRGIISKCISVFKK